MIRKFSVILLIIGIIISTSGCSFAGGVPKYNPKDPNPKPGLYYVGETKYFPGPATILKDGRVLIIERDLESGYDYHHIEIFDPTTGKFTKMKDFPYYIKLDYYDINYKYNIVLDDGRVLFNAGVVPQEQCPQRDAAELYQIFDPVNNSFSIVGRSAMCRVFHRYSDVKIYPYYSNETPYIMTKLKNGSVAAYCTTDFYGKKNPVYEMEIINVKNNTISKPIKKGNKNYINLTETNERFPKMRAFKYQDLINSYKQLYPEFNDDFIYFNIYKLTENRYLIISNTEADYGIRVAQVLHRGENRSAWFSPIYEYNTTTKKNKKKNEYLRSLTGRIYHLKDTNKLIIVGGAIRDVFPPINQNADPHKISFVNRVLYPDWAKKRTKKVYIYVY